MIKKAGYFKILKAFMFIRLFLIEFDLMLGLVSQVLDFGASPIRVSCDDLECSVSVLVDLTLVKVEL